MADAADRQELLTALTTEHLTLQGARSQTMSERPRRVGNMGVPAEGRSQFFSFATVVAIINSVVGGSAVAVASVLGRLRLAARLLTERTSGIEPMFPSR